MNLKEARKNEEPEKKKPGACFYLSVAYIIWVLTVLFYTFNKFLFSLIF